MNINTRAHNESANEGIGYTKRKNRPRKMKNGLWQQQLSHWNVISAFIFFSCAKKMLDTQWMSQFSPPIPQQLTIIFAVLLLWIIRSHFAIFSILHSLAFVFYLALGRTNERTIPSTDWLTEWMNERVRARCDMHDVVDDNVFANTSKSINANKSDMTSL